MKKLRKSVVAVLLTVSILAGTMWGNYQETKAAGIVAGYSALQVLQGIFAAFGFVGITADMINRVTSSDWWTDGSSALQPYYDDLASEYEKTRFEIINGGLKPQPSVTPEPNPSPLPSSAPAPDPKPEIPTFKELTDVGLTAGFLHLTQDTWDCLSKAVGKLWDKILGRAQNVDKGIPADEVNQIMSSGFPYFIRYKKKTDYRGYFPYILLLPLGSFRYEGSDMSYETPTYQLTTYPDNKWHKKLDSSGPGSGMTHDYSHFADY